MPLAGCVLVTTTTKNEGERIHDSRDFAMAETSLARDDDEAAFFLRLSTRLRMVGPSSSPSKST